MNRPKFMAMALTLCVGTAPLAASDHNGKQANHAQKVAWADHDHDRDAHERHMKREDLHREHREEAWRRRERQHNLRANEQRRDEHWRREHERHEKHIPPGQAKKLSEHRDHDHHRA